MLIEKEQFEPYLSGYLGNSLAEAEELQRKLQAFEPEAQVSNRMQYGHVPVAHSNQNDYLSNQNDHLVML